jgi:hypothetical protein
VRGIDSAHGNGDLSVKRRYHDVADDFPRHDVCSRGNCFKDPAYICGLLIDDNGGLTDSHDLPLETVKPVVTTPNCGGWLGTDCGIDFDECQADCMGPDSIPDLPGYEDNRRINEDGTYSELCGGWCVGSGVYLTSSWGCGIDMSAACNPDLVWAEIDLGINEELEPDDPEYLMPNLAPYNESPDLTLAGCSGRSDAWKKARLTWCLCQTQTGPTSCGSFWCDQELPA